VMKNVSKNSPIQNFIKICPHSPQTVTWYTYTHTGRHGKFNSTFLQLFTAHVPQNLIFSFEHDGLFTDYFLKQGW